MSVSSINSILRLSGMSSGMDTESMVKSLMSIEKLKVDRVAQEKTRLEWEKEAHKDINTLINSFRTATMSILSPETNLYTASAFNINTVTLTAPSDCVSLSAANNALAGANQIDSITRLATAASICSATGVTYGEALDLNTQLQNLPVNPPIIFGGANADEVSFSINGETFTFSQTDTLQSLFNQVNSSQANVSISYSELTNMISIQSRITGAGSSIEVENITGNLLGLDSAFGIAAGTFANGQDAQLAINGHNVTRSSNEFAIDGVQYVLRDTSAAAIRFSVEQNADHTVDKVKNFVKLYNQVVDALQSKISEEKYSDYAPLTDEQKEEMSETEIASWEAKSRSGILRNDRNLVNLLTQMRGMLYDLVEGTGTSLANIGLQTGAYYEKGKISLDEDRLRTALKANPDQVMQLFTHSVQTTDQQIKYDQSGFLPRLIEAFSQYTGQFNMMSADEAISKISKKVNDMNELLLDKEEQYWSKFAAMEKALSSMNAQSSWLSQQLG